MHAASPHTRNTATPRFGWGLVMSATLTLASFVLILAAVVIFEGNGRDGRTRQPVALVHSTPTSVDTAAATPTANAASSGLSPVAERLEAAPAPAGSAGELARARACALAKAWPCVMEAASAVLALEGGNTEAQTLLQRAIVEGGWRSETTPAKPVTEEVSASGVQDRSRRLALSIRRGRHGGLAEPTH
ncbi:hypothetical protein AYM40_02890 [Paraburkholderia phytofirmans OLGA172]|uniref:Uncharacterized protein n=2 Tax=Paraburkholderia phytofirmans TaxID=261302 RepID=A0A160FH35_9BURK|nr:hypothetical protein AYM40_02890 [Paraburkholderia phytofirmans OLGA172]